MTGTHVSRAILGGFVATIAMTILAYAGPMFGMPRMDFAAMLGGFLTGQPAPLYSQPWWVGMTIHFIDGTILFALIYAYLLYPILAGRPWLRGLTWGVILWFLSQVIVMPMMGYGVFSRNAPNPSIYVLAALMAHVVYGAILGAIAGPQAVRLRERPPVERHA